MTYLLVKVFALFVALAGLATGWAGAQEQGAPVLPPPDEFAEAARWRMIGRERLMQEMLEETKGTGRQVFVADEPPGSTGLRLAGAGVGTEVAPAPFQSLVYSLLHSFGQGEKPLTTTVVSLVPAQRRSLFSQSMVSLAPSERRSWFSNYLASDYGYVFDPLWMGRAGKRWLVFKAGRPGERSLFYLYGFQPTTGRIHRLLPSALKNTALTVSPDHRFLTYIVGGSTGGMDPMFGGMEPLKLWVWDSQTERNFRVATNEEIANTYRWISPTELLYSRAETGGEQRIAVAFVWNALTGQSRRWMVNCQGPVLAPNRSQVVYAAQVAPPKNTRTGYFLKNFKTGKKVALGQAVLGSVYLGRQLVWSPDSRLIFSLLNFEDGVRVYDAVTGQSWGWPLKNVVAGNETDARIVAASSQGKRVFVLLAETTANNHLLHQFDCRYSLVSIETATGRQQVVWTREGLLGVSENSLVLSRAYLQD